MLLGVPGEMTKLETTLRDLSRILADAERRRIRDRDSATEGWVKELKDAMYDTDDVLDLCRLMEGGGGPSTPISAPRWCCEIPNPFFCLRNPVVAYEIGRKIQAINQQLEDFSKRCSRFDSSHKPSTPPVIPSTRLPIFCPAIPDQFLSSPMLLVRRLRRIRRKSWICSSRMQILP